MDGEANELGERMIEMRVNTDDATTPRIDRPVYDGFSVTGAGSTYVSTRGRSGMTTYITNAQA